jgi:hypothetical protein
MMPNIRSLAMDDPNRPDPHQYGKQAYTCSHDSRFKKFASELEPDATVEYVHDVAQFISGRCGVIALRFIDDNPEAIVKWQAMKAEYQGWLDKQDAV